MDQESLGQQLISEFANIGADIALGKNLEKHLETINQEIATFNEKIYNASASGEKYESFQVLAYHYYWMRDRLIEMQNKTEL